MSPSIQLLKDRYLKNIKENPDLYIGIELEFPIVHTKGQPTDIEVSKDLMRFLVDALSLEVEKEDQDGNPIQLVEPMSHDRILFEVSYTTLEFAFGRAQNIQEVEGRFETYMKVIQRKLGEKDHAIQGWGIHPNWDINDNRPVVYPRYQMLMDYLSMGSHQESAHLHDFPQYGAFICGSQVQLDVSTANYLRVINAFTQIESAKAFLFANSEFSGADWDTQISRDIFWEESMHGIYPENVGVNTRLFKDEDDFFDYLDHSAIFTAERDGETYYFSPIQARDYLATNEIHAYTINGKETLLAPQEKDFQTHRSYQFQDLTTRGTVGNVAYYDESIKYKHLRINSGMVILRPKKPNLNQKFIIHVLRNNNYSRMISGSAQPQLPITKLKKMPLPLPPLSLQNEFADFVAQVDKSQFACQMAIKLWRNSLKSSII